VRVVFVTSSSTPSGGARQVVYLARSLAGQGHEVSLFMPADGQLAALAPELDWRRLPERRGDWRAAVAGALPFGRPFVLQAFHNKAVKRLSWWGLFWRRRGAVTVATRGVCYRPGNPLPWISPGLDAIVTNSLACAKVLASVGAPRRKLNLIDNAIPPERLLARRARDEVRAELNLPPGALLFGTVAGNKPVKGVAPLIEGFALAALPTAHLVVIGVKPSKFAPQVEALGLSGRVHLVGRTEAVADYLRAMDAFVQPSLSESMPNTMLEAVACGLPVLATAVGGVPEVVNQGLGMLVPPNQPEALAVGLRAMAADPDRRLAFAAAARALAPRFSPEAKVAAALALYRRLAAARGLTLG